MQDLILRDSKGELVVTSLTIAEVFGRPHDAVLKSIDKVNSQLVDIANEVKITFVKGKDKEGIRNTRTAYLNERQFLMVMPFVGGEKALQGQIKLVDEFMRLRAATKTLEQQRRELLLDAPDAWIKLFDETFYTAIMLLHNDTFTTNSKTPMYCANITYRHIYSVVLGHELLRELKDRKHSEKLHQWFKDGGRLELAKQIERVTMIARMCVNRSEFESKCAIMFHGKPLQLTAFN
jgi:phage regulator Rha-like protein